MDDVDIRQQFDDQYGILTYQYIQRRTILFNNPFLDKDSMNKTFLYIAFDDKEDVSNKPTVIGRCYYFPTQLKLCDKIVLVQSGSAVYVQEAYRHQAVGAEMFTFSTFSEDYEQRLYAGISPMALPIFRKLRYNVFSMQRLFLRKNYSPYLLRKVKFGKLVSLLSPIINYFATLPLHLYGKTHKMNKKFIVELCDRVPQWVDGMVLNDGHKFMEIHNHKWMQWQLQGAFRSEQNNKQQFYAIYKKDRQPIGFFLTKQRILDKKNKFFLGSIVEWGSNDEMILSESNIYELALNTFSKDVYMIDIATDTYETISRMKILGFVDGGKEHIIYKNNIDTIYNDIQDQKMWRLRYGYADTVFS